MHSRTHNAVILFHHFHCLHIPICVLLQQSSDRISGAIGPSFGRSERTSGLFLF